MFESTRKKPFKVWFSSKQIFDVKTCNISTLLHILWNQDQHSLILQYFMILTKIIQKITFSKCWTFWSTAHLMCLVAMIFVNEQYLYSLSTRLILIFIWDGLHKDASGDKRVSYLWFCDFQDRIYSNELVIMR